VQNMVKSMQIQASSVSETSASIDEMVASIQCVADTAKVLLDISNRSREEVHSGITTMEKGTEGLNKINGTIMASGEIIGVLGHRTDDIGRSSRSLTILQNRPTCWRSMRPLRRRVPESMGSASPWSPTK